MRYMLKLAIAALAIASIAAAADAATWNVNPGGGGDATTIQGGINLAANGDVVLVAAGTYTGAGNVNVSFNGKNITVSSTAGAYYTIVDCQNTAAGFKFENGENGAVLEGFTVRNAFAVKGAAILCDDTSPTVRYCVFKDNVATTSGGAIYARKGGPVFYNNTLDGNSAPAGGGFWVQGPGSPQVYQNIVCNSVAGGAFGCAGALSAYVACNDTYANAGGNANIICAGDNGDNFTQDPLFCGIPGTGNFFLQQTSPCAASYSPCAAPVGALGVQCQVTATENHTWGGVKSLYR